ncbi:hypothetical protein ABEB36_002733 [Hypothenemus hampei]|uniref:CHK kinase-like domain-containing protein n=1 Tax=Hypothenemus hampei TaxID=57062 RepID=A0ABD1F6U3_HYPHA
MVKNIVTRADCDYIITKYIGSDQFEVVNFKVKPFEDKEREYYKPDCVLEISVKVSKKIERFRFFIKSSSKGYEREIFFYKEFIPHIFQHSSRNINIDFVPNYFFGDHRFIIIEDMSLKYFTLSKKAHMLDRFHVCLVLNSAAKLHAASLAYEELHKDSEASRLFDQNDLVSEDLLWKKNSRNLVNSGLKAIKILLKENVNLEAIVNKTFETMQYQTKYRSVLIHGDLHTKNVLFKYTKNLPEDCVLINFGCCKYFLPAYDVLTLIFFSTTKLFRQHYFTYLIKFYYESLHKELLKYELHIDRCFTFEDFKQTVNYLMPSIKLRTLLHLQDFGAKPGFYKSLQKDEKAYYTYLNEDKSAFIEELLQRDPIFKDLLIEATQELLEVIEIPQVTRENCYEIIEEELGTTVYDLKSFDVKHHGDSDKDFYELVVRVSGNFKEDEVTTFRYLVQCGADNYFKVLNKLSVDDNVI